MSNIPDEVKLPRGAEQGEKVVEGIKPIEYSYPEPKKETDHE